MMARPRNEDRIDIPALAVKHAARLFAERGVEGVSLKEIADAVGCRAPALYRYFPDKDALLLAVHDEGFRRLYAAKLETHAEVYPPALERLRLGGLRYVRFAFDQPALYELMFMERGPFRRLEALRADGTTAPLDAALRSLDFLRSTVVDCQKDGYLQGIDPDLAAFTYWSMVNGAIILTLRRRAPVADADPDGIATRAVETMIELVRSTSSNRQESANPR